MIVYNLGVTCLNLYIALELLIASTSLNYSYICQPYKQIHSKGELQVSIAWSKTTSFIYSYSNHKLQWVRFCRSREPFGGSISPNVSSFSIVSSSYYAKRRSSYHFCMFITTAPWQVFLPLNSLIANLSSNFARVSVPIVVDRCEIRSEWVQ